MESMSVVLKLGLRSRFRAEGTTDQKQCLRMKMNSTRERVNALRQRVQDGEDLGSSIDELKGILSADCAELDKAQVA